MQFIEIIQDDLQKCHRHSTDRCSSGFFSRFAFMRCSSSPAKR